MRTMRAMDAAFLAMERPDGAPPPRQRVDLRPGPERAAHLRGRRATCSPSGCRSSRRRRRVVVEVPLGLGRPSWATDRRFDLEFHLRHTAVPASGGMSALADFIARTHARPLDRSRPLWELWVIDGLPDGRVALYAKIHMAAIDDVTGAEVMTALLDADPLAVVHVQPEARHHERDDQLQRWLGAAAGPVAPGDPLPPPARRPGDERRRQPARRHRRHHRRDDPPHPGHGAASPGFCRRRPTGEVLDERTPVGHRCCRGTVRSPDGAASP